MYMPDDFLEALEKKSEEEKRYHKSQYHYDKGNDIYWCPERKKLSLYTEVLRDGEKPLGIYRGEECGSCLVGVKCTKGTVRTVILKPQYQIFLRVLFLSW